MEMPFYTGGLLKEAVSPYPSPVQGAFQASHMKVTASGI